MPVVVLLRGANLGSKRFSAKALAADLADLGAVNIGAAGTLVIHGRATDATLRARFAAALPFEPELLILTENEVRAALKTGAKMPVLGETRRFATAMATAPLKPALPIEAPPGKAWGVRVLAIEGRIALGLRKRVDETGVYPNAVIEKSYDVRATTRDWPTMEKIGRLLE